MTKKTPFCILANHPLFLLNVCFFYQVTLSHVCKAVIRWTHYKNSAFSRTQLLGITDSKTPSRGPFSKWHFCNQKCYFGFYPCACWNPYFSSVLSLGMATKERTIFQKQIVATKMRIFFFTFRTQIVFAYFSKKWQFYKKRPFFFTTTPKTLFSGFFFNNFPCPFFSYFPFYFFQHKKDKIKSAPFFSKTLFWHPDNVPKKYFRTPTHYLWF